MDRRITFVIMSLYRGGAETQLVRVATGLASAGWQVEIITIISLNDFARTLEGAGVAVRSLGMTRGRYDPRALTRLARMLRESRPTVVCTFMFHANVLGRIVARLNRVPIVVSSIRNAEFGGRWADVLMRWTDALADVTTTNSELAGAALTARGVVKEQRLRILPNGIETGPPQAEGRSREAVRAELGFEEADRIWLSVGRLEPQKAHDLAVRAVAELLEAGHELRLVIVGEGGQMEMLESLRSRLGLEGRVSLLGHRKDVRELMLAADGMLLASRWEGLPNVILEALVAGLPVVATDVGGVRELITDGRTGVVVAPGDPAALARGVERVIGMDPEERRAMVEAGRRHVTERYALPKALADWEELFTSLVESREAGARRAVGAGRG